MPKKPKSYDDLLRGQQPAGEASDWDWPERAAARRRSELTPAQKAALKRQEAATDKFVKRRLKKESIMKTLKRVVLEQDNEPRLKGKTPEEKAKRAEILKRTLKTKAERNARFAKTGETSTRPGYSSVDDSITPLTAGRVFMFEGSFQNMRRAAKAGNQYAADRMMAKNLGKTAEYHISSRNTGSSRGGIADSLVQAGKTNKDKANRLRLRAMKAEQRVDEISAEKFDAMGGKERSEYGANVARRYRRMAANKQAKDKNFTPDKDLSRPLSALRKIKDKSYERAGRHEELKKLKARRNMPFKKASMGGRDRGEEMAREAGDRR